MARTLYEKLVDSHTVLHIDEHNVLLYIDLHLMNEYTSPQAFSALDARGRAVRRPRQQLAVVSHIIPTHAESPRIIRDAASLLQASNLARNCERAGIRLFAADDPLQGIEHIVAPELGLIRPGMVVLCGDSHTTTYGALGALGFGIGTSEVEHVLATQTLVYRLARTMRITIDGALPYGTSSKDMILWVISRIGAGRARLCRRIRRLDDRRAFRRGAHDHVQHDGRSGRARRADRAGRDHVRICTRARAIT